MPVASKCLATEGPSKRSPCPLQISTNPPSASATICGDCWLPKPPGTKVVLACDSASMGKSPACTVETNPSNAASRLSVLAHFEEQKDGETSSPTVVAREFILGQDFSFWKVDAEDSPYRVSVEHTGGL